MQHLLWNAKQRGNTAARFQLENKIIALKIALYFFILWRALFRLDNHPFLYSRYLPSPHPLSPIPLKFGRNGRRSLWQLYFQHQHRRWRQPVFQRVWGERFLTFLMRFYSLPEAFCSLQPRLGDPFSSDCRSLQLLEQTVGKEQVHRIGHMWVFLWGL